MKSTHAGPVGAFGILLGVALCLSPALQAEEKTSSATKTNAPEGEKAAEAKGTLTMEPGIACLSIKGYEDYEPLPGPELTSDEKLLVYYRPHGFKVEEAKSSYHVHLSQDGQIRRKGEKAVLLRKAKLLDYEFTVDHTPYPIYHRNTFSLKGLKPGEYEYDIILHDLLAKTPPVTQSVRFRVIAAEPPKAEESPEEADEPTTEPKPKRKARRATAPRS
ncbi:hypothetical protein ACYOEI_16765 [Singulisphaera rosea]